MTWAEFNAGMFCDRSGKERYYYLLKSERELNIVLNVLKTLEIYKICSALTTSIKCKWPSNYIHMGDYCLGSLSIFSERVSNKDIENRYRGMKEADLKTFLRRLKKQKWPELQNLSVKTWIIDNRKFLEI